MCRHGLFSCLGCRSLFKEVTVIGRQHAVCPSSWILPKQPILSTLQQVTDSDGWIGVENIKSHYGDNWNSDRKWYLFIFNDSFLFLWRCSKEPNYTLLVKVSITVLHPDVFIKDAIIEAEDSTLWQGPGRQLFGAVTEGQIHMLWK